MKRDRVWHQDLGKQQKLAYAKTSVAYPEGSENLERSLSKITLECTCIGLCRKKVTPRYNRYKVLKAMFFCIIDDA